MGRGDPPQEMGSSPPLQTPPGFSFSPRLPRGHGRRSSHTWAPSLILSFKFVIWEPFPQPRSAGRAGAAPRDEPRSPLPREDTPVPRGDPSPNPAAFPHKVALSPGLSPSSAPVLRPPQAPAFTFGVATFSIAFQECPPVPKACPCVPRTPPWVLWAPALLRAGWVTL